MASVLFVFLKIKILKILLILFIGYIIVYWVLYYFFPDLYHKIFDEPEKSDGAGAQQNVQAESKSIEPEEPKSVFSYFSYKIIAQYFADEFDTELYNYSFSAKEFRSLLLKTNTIAMNKNIGKCFIFDDQITNITSSNIRSDSPAIVFGDGHSYYRNINGIEAGCVSEEFEFELEQFRDNMEEAERLNLADRVIIIGILKFWGDRPYFTNSVIIKVNNNYPEYFEDILRSISEDP